MQKDERRDVLGQGKKEEKVGFDLYKMPIL